MTARAAAWSALVSKVRAMRTNRLAAKYAFTPEYMGHCAGRECAARYEAIALLSEYKALKAAERARQAAA